MTDPFQIARLPHRLADALRGIYRLLRTCANARIHLLATVSVVGLGLWLKLTRADWLWITLAIAGVWTAEGINSAIETLADRISRDHDVLIREAKDLAAGAVLIAALGAAAIGLIIFIPRLLAL
ncbi:MAG TPA: diacylglycerol kinase family protein [Gammaproteobacteria bacterium]|nr:diacylglycerol kinase family protein [Gammaproteobacteria bacterium]